MKRKITLLATERAYDGFFKVDAYRLRQEADGRSFEFTRLNFERGRAAALMLYDPDLDSVLCVEEFRIGNFAAGLTGEDAFSLGPIAGMIDAGETPRNAAIREAREEAGVEIEDAAIFSEFTTLPSPGGSSEMVTMLLATADLSGIEEDVFGVEGEDEQTWRRVVSRSEILAHVETRPVTGHLAALVMKLEILRLQDAIPSPRRDASRDPSV